MIQSSLMNFYSTWGMCPSSILYPSCTSILATKGFRINVNKLSSLTKSKTKHQENLAVMVKLKNKNKNTRSKDIRHWQNT